VELGLLEGAPCSNREVGLCTVPRTTLKGAKMVDEVDVYWSGAMESHPGLMVVARRARRCGWYTRAVAAGHPVDH